MTSSTGVVPTTWNWEKIKEDFDLFDARPGNQWATKRPNKINYVMNGIAPLSIKTITTILQSQGTNQQIASILDSVGLGKGRVFWPMNEQRLYQQKRPLKILVYFLGGITYAEIAALRHI